MRLRNRLRRFDILALGGTFGWIEVEPQTTGRHNFPILEATVGQFRSVGL